MLEFFYPTNLRKIFTNRRSELELLKFYRAQHKEGRPVHLALFGLRRIGKTILLKQFVLHLLKEKNDVIPVYMDFSDICSSPENFATGYIGQVCYWFLTRGQDRLLPYLEYRSLYAEALKAQDEVVTRTVSQLYNELNAARPDRQLLLHLAFGFPEELALEHKGKFILIFDEFQEIETLKNFKETTQIISLFRANLQRQSQVLYILAGSAVSVITKLVSDHESPLFAQFQKVPIEAFTQEDAFELAGKLTPTLQSEQALREIYLLSGGHPYYISQICERLNRFQALYDLSVDQDLVKQAFLVETLSSEGKIYDYCRYIYDLSLQKARGYGSLKSVLQILSAEEGLRSSEVARRLKVTSGTAIDYLRWLQEVDLVTEDGKEYYFRDPVLRYWVANAARGVEVPLTPSKKDLAGLVKKLDEQFQRAAQELGIAKESQIRELISRFDGQAVDGALFHTSNKISLPSFKKVAPYRSEDGQVEIDCLAEDGQKWAVEIKWRRKLAGKEEIERLIAKVGNLADILWFISRDGFTEEALELAAKKKIFLSTRKDLETLAKTLELK